MSNEVEVMDAVAVQNYQAAHSVMVMEQWGNGEVYSEERWIERGRLAVRQTMEGMFELGRALIVLKEHTEHGRFENITKEQFGIGKMEASRLMRAPRVLFYLRYSGDKMTQKPQPLVPWMGGKRRLAKHLIPMFSEHSCYVELFAGRAALFFLRPQPAKCEVLNDIDGQLINLYRVVQHHFDEFVRQFD